MALPLSILTFWDARPLFFRLRSSASLVEPLVGLWRHSVLFAKTPWYAGD